MTPAHRSRLRSRGFTLVETLITVAIAGVLASLALPSFEGHLLRARRADALLALMQAQLAQERYRAGNTSYGSLAETGMRSTSSAGHYALQATAVGADSYDLLASATAGQARDTSCRHLRLSSLASGITFASGPDATTANPADANRKCWNR